MTDEPIEEIKRNLSLERIVSRSASDWSDQSTGGRVGRCTHPVHGHTSDNSNAGNLIVTDDGGWYCYSHDTSGDLFSWIAVEEGIVSCDSPELRGDDFVETLRIAADRAGVELDSGPSPDSYDEAEQLESISDYKKAQYALDEAVDVLHENLSKVVGEVTVRRLIKDNRPFGDDVIDRLRVGYLDGDAYAELLRRLSKEALEDIGLKREDGGQHGTGRIIYPYYDGQLPTFWVGRRTENSEMEAKYLKPHRSGTVLEEPIFKYRPTNRSPEAAVWITEGIQDAVALGEHAGVRAVSPVCKDPSSAQMDQIIEVAQDEGRAVISFDADTGGEGGAVRVATDLMSAGVTTEIAPLPEGTDPCDFFMDGGDYSDIEPIHAAERIVDVKGESDAVLRQLLDTVDPETPRADRLVDTLYKCTSVRVEVLRDLLQQEREYEHQQGWREPSVVKKTKGADPEWTFVYPDGTEITMESLAGRRACSKFADRYGSHFNYIPDISPSEFREMVNDWMREIEVVEVDPLSTEGRTRENILQGIQQAVAVPDTDHLSAVGEDAVVYLEDDGTVLVRSETVGDWLEDLGVSLRQAAEYASPILVGPSKRYYVDGSRQRFWRVDADEVAEEGYALPDVEAVPSDDDGDVETEEEL